MHLQAAGLALSTLCAIACGPSVLEVSPAVLSAGDSVEIFGTGFSPTASARLVADGGAIQLLVASATSGTISASVPGATPAGVYDVEVNVDGAVAVLTAGLTVQAGQARVRFIDVGQGDATVIIGPDGSAMLIDGGPPSSFASLQSALADIEKLEHVVVTHTDADHLGGIVELLIGGDGVAGTSDDVIPKTRWIGHDDVVCDSQLCREFRRLNAEFARPQVGDSVDLGGVTVEVVGRDGDFGAAGSAAVVDLNERSLALVARFAGRTVFIGGDLTGGGLGSVDVEAVAADAVGPVDVLRINHHGSATSSSAGFLSALQPRVAVVSVGTDNPFCHPEVSVVERLAQAGPTVVSTGRGIVETGGRCAVTDWPSGSRVGLGSIELSIDVNGEMSLDGDPL
jgi:beta-lactamase superfamily II metal-dependent hydrolase